ncbi:unnamed protein product [Cuscuta europaea]|uniref:DUF4005 domain-containing protein n=1 Tax=Cuscuta europaea TaxID=41803 RepID=A0A9P0YMI8_CUSEU|nr:unnamed protein product [Cuscuta europaea]
MRFTSLYPSFRAATSSTCSYREHHCSMGKKLGGSSWLTAIKNAFRSPIKETSSIDSKSSRRRDQHELEEDEEKQKREKRRRWLFRKPHTQQSTEVIAGNKESMHAITKHRFTRPSSRQQQHFAAVSIQTAFRGYLARRALLALKGIVKLQALIRGQNVRKQAKMTLKCMQALLRVQARVRDQRARLSHDGGGRKSMFSEAAPVNLLSCTSMHPPERRRQKSLSRDGSSIADDWRDCPKTLEEVEALLQARKEEVTFIQRSQLLHAVPQQGWSSEMEYEVDEKEQEKERANWLEEWMSSKQWNSINRASTERRDHIKTVEIDTCSPYSYTVSSPTTRRRSQHHKQSPSPPCYQRTSSLYGVPHTMQHPSTPSPCKPKQLQIRSSSPLRRLDKSYSTANTPCLRTPSARIASRYSTSSNEVSVPVPNYMAATESAKARIRSQSAPRQRPSTPERERGGSAKKRLSYLIPESSPLINVETTYGRNLRSPSFKSVQAGYVGMENYSSTYSCQTYSIGGEISPSSTTDL